MEKETAVGKQIVHRFTCESTDALRSPSRLVRMYSSSKDANEQRQIQSMYEEIEKRVAAGRALLDDEEQIERPLNYTNMQAPELILHEQKEDTRSRQLLQTRTHKSLQEQLERELSRETEQPDGLRSSVRQHIVQRLTTLTPFAQPDEDCSLKEKVLRWAQRSTEGYPRVLVTDLTTSFRDGLALNAILHRNRPELFEYESLFSCNSYECVEHALNAYERECAISKSIRVEQIQNQPAEADALFEYILRIYRHFPNPPYRNPLEDERKRKEIREFELRAAALLQWIRDTTVEMAQREILEKCVKRISTAIRDVQCLRDGELQDRLAEKRHLIALEKQAWKWAGQLGWKLDAQYSAENLDLLWTRMMNAIAARDLWLRDLMREAQLLEKIAQAVRDECKRVDAALDSLQVRVDAERRLIATSDIEISVEAFAIDELTDEIKRIGDRIMKLFAECEKLRSAHYPLVDELVEKVQRLHDRWSNLHRAYQRDVLEALAERRAAAMRRPATEEELIAAHAEFRLLSECIRWVQAKIAQVSSASYGEDLLTVKIAQDEHRNVHREVNAYQTNVNTCERHANLFTGHALEIYEGLLHILQRDYAELLVLCTQRASRLDALLEFVNACADLATWADERASCELRRDWSAVVTSGTTVHAEAQIHRLQRELPIKREEESFLKRKASEMLAGDSHPAAKTIQAHLDLVTQRLDWLQILTNCSTTHLKDSNAAIAFRTRADTLRMWIENTQRDLNSRFVVSSPAVDTCEQLLSELNKIKTEIEAKRFELQWLEDNATRLVPVVLRSRQINTSIQVTCLASVIRAGQRLNSQSNYVLRDNSDLLSWLLINGSNEQFRCESVLFQMQPPDNETTALLEKLRAQYAALIDLWANRSHKLRVALVAATLAVLQGWDYDTYISMAEPEIAAILQALEEDIEKLVREGPPDDPDTRRLQDDLRALKRKFADFDERRRRQAEDDAARARVQRYMTLADDLLQQLREKERELLTRCAAPIPVSVEQLQSISAEFSEFEYSIKRLESRITQSRAQYAELGSVADANATRAQDTINELWSWLLKHLALFSDRLRELRPALVALAQSQKALSQVDGKLMGSLSSNNELERVAADLRDAETAIAQHQPQLAQLSSVVNRAAGSVLKTRKSDHANADVHRLENDAAQIVTKMNRLQDALRGLASKLQQIINDIRRADQEISASYNDRSLAPIATTDVEMLRDQLAALQRLEKQRLPELLDICDKLQSQGEQIQLNMRSLSDYSRIERTGSELMSQLERLQQRVNELRKTLSERIIAAQNALDSAIQLNESRASLLILIGRINEQIQPCEQPALEPEAISAQLRIIQLARAALLEADRLLDAFKLAAARLLELCGEPVRPELRSAQESLESQLVALRNRLAALDAQLNAALDLAREFTSLLAELLDRLDQWEEELTRLSQPEPDVAGIRGQLQRLRALRERVNSEQHRLDRFCMLSQRLLQLPADATARQPIRESTSEVNGRHAALLRKIAECEQMLEAELQRAGQWAQLLAELLQWLSGAEQQLASIQPAPADVNVLADQLARVQQLREQIDAHQPSVDRLNSARDALGSNSELADLNRRWTRLCDGCENKWAQLRKLHEEATRLADELSALLAWLDELDTQLASNKPFGALPETAKAQLDEFLVAYSQLERQVSRVEQALRETEAHLRSAAIDACRELRTMHSALASRWETSLSRANERKVKLELALQDAITLQDQLNELTQWLAEQNNILANAPTPSALLDPLVEQLDEHKRLQDALPGRREATLHLDRRVAQLRYVCDKRDAATLTNRMADLQAAWERLVAACAARAAQLDAAYKQVREFFDLYDELNDWLDGALAKQAALQPAQEESAARLAQLLQVQKDLARLAASRQGTYERVLRLGAALQRIAPAHERPELARLLDELRAKWESLQQKALEQQRALEEALLLAGQIREAIRALLAWADNELARLDGEKRLYGDLDTVKALIEAHRRFETQLQAKRRSAQLIAESAEKLLSTSQAEEAPLLQRQLNSLHSKLEQLALACEKRAVTLADALRLAEQLDALVHELLDWLSGAEKRLRAEQPSEDADMAALQRAQAAQGTFEHELDSRRPLREQCTQLIADLLTRCHPDAISPLNHWNTIVASRWEEVVSWSRRANAKISERLSGARELEQLAEQLLEWLGDAERRLDSRVSEDADARTLLAEHQLFIDQMSAKQPSVERVLRAGGKSKSGASGNQLLAGSSATFSRGSKRFTLSSDAQVEREWKSESARALSERWRHVWIRAMERQRELQRTIEASAGEFNFDQWGRRLLDHCKASQLRPADFFRRLDAKNEGAVPVSAFADRCMATDFRCSRAEGERAARALDSNGDRMVDQQEFVEMLGSVRPVAQTEHEIIMDELQRQVGKCNCISRFRVYHVGEGKYRFGDSAKLRLVRIVRNSITVRVGGGWESLDEFLAKNDPCRGKSRAPLNENKEAKYEGLISESPSLIPYPKGVVVTSSREKLYSSSSNCPASRTERLSIRTKDQSSNSPSNYGLDESNFKSPSRSRLTFSSSISNRPTSRQSSRPPSRAGSELSLESMDMQRRTPTLTRKFTSATSISSLVRRNQN